MLPCSCCSKKPWRAIVKRSRRKKRSCLGSLARRASAATVELHHGRVLGYPDAAVGALLAASDYEREKTVTQHQCRCAGSCWCCLVVRGGGRRRRSTMPEMWAAAMGAPAAAAGCSKFSPFVPRCTATDDARPSPTSKSMDQHKFHALSLSDPLAPHVAAGL